jgi:hypothetical protein
MRVHRGIPAFARVTVCLLAGEENIEVRDGALRDKAPREWLDAARSGAQRALAEHRACDGRSQRVLLHSIEGAEVDTTAATVEVASFAAVWKALGGDETRLVFQFDGDWTVRVDGES